MEVMTWIKGDTGEVLTAQALRNNLGFNTIRNLYLPYYDGVTEVDIIGLCSRGIFVIENKNYTGRVLPVFEDKDWIVIYPTGRAKLYNPIMQNRRHVAALKDLLTKAGYEHLTSYVCSVVVFNDGVLRKEFYNGNEKVLSLSSFVDKFDFLYPDCNNLTEDDIKKVRDSLASYYI